MVLEAILLFIILNVLRKTVKKSGKIREWSSFLIAAVSLTAGLLVLYIVYRPGQPIITWVTYAVVAALYYLVFSKKDFAAAKPLMYAFLPLIGINFIEEVIRFINKAFYAEWDNYFEVGELIALVWMIAMLISNSRQKKALEKERLKTEEKEKEFRITQKLKAELEVQVQERTAEITRQKEELEHTLNELKSTQAQLVQSEKMASLGELTAGIAHEIQNPLNFVNNFSEVSNELLDEMREELDKGDIEEAKAIAEDVRQNLEKINHHGKRADAIVKGMLQHSRSSNGIKEASDINALCDEYMRLSYHGLRAKDKSFNATIKTDFDNSIGKINIISQDIGRVVMNLLTNAFYAVNSKTLSAGLPPTAADKESAPSVIAKKYEPTVSISTKKFPDKVSIIVSDNGAGIPPVILDKIYQPFFTTKPAGEGTGLGLSLSYDIIVKGHNGKLAVETNTEGARTGTEFTIELPI